MKNWRQFVKLTKPVRSRWLDISLVLFLQYRTGHCPEWSRTCVFASLCFLQSCNKSLIIQACSGPYWENIGPRSFCARSVLPRPGADILPVRPSRMVNKIYLGILHKLRISFQENPIKRKVLWWNLVLRMIDWRQFVELTKPVRSRWLDISLVLFLQKKSNLVNIQPPKLHARPITLIRNFA